MNAKCYKCGDPTKKDPKRGVLCHKCAYSKNAKKYIERSARWRKNNREKFNKGMALRYMRDKRASIEAYGGKCGCGISDIRFLTIDHINNDGAENRRSWHGKTATIHIWLKKNQYPDGYRVLCGNCNMKKEIERRRARASKTWKNSQEAKSKVMASYGAECRCCSEDDQDKLVIDHVNGGGSEEKKSYPARNVYYFLKGKDVDHSRYQILCQNCNQAKHSFGRCPHNEDFN